MNKRQEILQTVYLWDARRGRQTPKPPKAVSGSGLKLLATAEFDALMRAAYETGSATLIIELRRK